MLFNSFAFILFFPIVVLLYFAVPKKLANYVLLIASYYFYIYWNPHYVYLIILSSFSTYYCALRIEKSLKHKKAYLLLAVFFNLFLLGLFKYYGFLAHNVNSVLHLFGKTYHIPEFSFILPLGISFYTFHVLAYIIDVYRGVFPAEKNIFTYFLFVSFFPQLIAGPISRAGQFLVQFKKERKFNYEQAVAGSYLIIWGLFKKILVADVASIYVNAVYTPGLNFWSHYYIIAVLFFALEIYADFSAYSDIARGCAKILGFELISNFRQPFLSKNIQDFWTRWHISLTTWFTDYLYPPISLWLMRFIENPLNIYAFSSFIVFIVAGIWHGAAWHFFVFGLIHAIGIFVCAYYIKVFKKEIQKYTNKFVLTFINLFNRLLFIIWILFAWIFFRASDLSQAFFIIKKIFFWHTGGVSLQKYLTNDGIGIDYNITNKIYLYFLCLIPVLLISTFTKEYFPQTLNNFRNSKWYIRWFIYTFLVTLLGWCFYYYMQYFYFIGITPSQFIYFQF